MKRVAFVYSGGRSWGGIETYLANLFRLHDPSRLDLMLISLGEWELTRRLSDAGLAESLLILPAKRLRLSTVADLRAIVGREHLHVLVSQGTVANAYARLAALITSVPNMVVVHSDITLDYPRLPRLAYKLSDRLLRRVTRHYIAVSQNLKAKLVASGVAGERVTVIYNGVDADVETGDQGTPAGVLLASAGRLHPVKNYDALIRAVALLPEHVRLDIWGEGEQRVSLSALATELGLGDRVRLPGASRDMAHALTSADIYVQPSLSEGCSFAVAEAMLHSKPVVVTPRGGLVEQVQDGVTGLVADDCTPEALARAITRLVNDKALAGRLGDAARRAAKDKYSLKRWLTETTKTLLDTAESNAQD